MPSTRPIGLALSMHARQRADDRGGCRERLSRKSPLLSICRHGEALLSYTQVNFDLLGLSFSQHIKPGPRGPQMRSNRLSFFKEITSDEMRSYAPDQIATILEQRDNVSEPRGMPSLFTLLMNVATPCPSSTTEHGRASETPLLHAFVWA